MKRYLEFVGHDSARGVENSSKFWEGWVEAETLHTRFGKIGSTGQTTAKSFPSEVDAASALDKAVAAKVKKGYVEQAGEEHDTSVAESSPAEDVQSELAKCAAPETTAREIDSILEAHEDCVEWEGKCWMCCYLADDEEDKPDDLWGENIFVALSRRSDLTPLQQDKIVTAGVNAGPMEALLVSILPNIAEHSSGIPDEVKEVVLGPFEYVSSVLEDDYEMWAVELLDTIRENSSFSSSEVDQFLAYHEELDLDFAEPGDEELGVTDDVSDVICSSCDKALPSGARFCTECGGEATSGTLACSQCDAELEPADRFCGSCGAPTDDLVDSSEPENTVPIAQWMMSAISALSRNRKIRRVDFLAGAQSTLVFSIEFSGEDFDLRLNESLLDLDTLIGPSYLDFTDRDAVEPEEFVHAYWSAEDFEGLGPEIMEDIVRMIGSEEWVKSTTVAGVMREKTEVERWN